MFLIIAFLGADIAKTGRCPARRRSCRRGGAIVAGWASSDNSRVDGVDVTAGLVVVSETGTAISKFPNDKHFASWMGLCPGIKISGGKVLSGKTKRCANRAAQALRLAAAALRTSQSALGAYFRRLCSRMDKPKAVTAAAHKLARLIYAMLTKDQEYTDQGQDCCEERYARACCTTGGPSNSA